jgi:Tol biopolymer transport system component
MGRAKHWHKKKAMWDADGARNVVAEGAAAGTGVGIDVSALIRNAKGPIVYSLVDDAGGAFRIDPKTGVVTVADGSRLDYETAQHHTIRVKATVGHKSVYEHFHISVADRPEAELISAAPGGRAVEGDSPDLSGDGRFVAFRSSSPDLIPGDRDNEFSSDVFVRDRQTGLVERVSVNADGSGGAEAFTPAISADGRYVAYVSFASTILAGDTNDTADVFVFDRATHTTKRVSVASDGTQSNDYSGVSDFAEAPALSADGRFIAFESKASNLVANDTNQGHDIFVHDQQTGTTARVSVASSGAQSNGWSHDPSMSADGRYVTYMSFASNLVAGDDEQRGDVFLYDRLTGTTERISETRNGEGGSDNSGEAEISANGRFVAYSSYASNLVQGDTNGVPDVFVFDRVTGVTERVSLKGDGTQLARGSFDPEISADGRYVMFENEASDYAGPVNPDRQVFVYDRYTDKLAQVARGFFPNPSLSDDGQSLAYVEGSSVFAAQTRDLFI